MSVEETPVRSAEVTRLWEAAADTIDIQGGDQQRAIRAMSRILTPSTGAQPGDKASARTAIGSLQIAERSGDGELAARVSRFVSLFVLPYAPVGAALLAREDTRHAHGWNGGRF